MAAAEFVIVGGGWRAEFFLRAARELPDRIRARGMLVRDSAKGEMLSARWGIPTFRTIDELLAPGLPLFAVVSTPRTVTPAILADLTARGLPVLCETPPAGDIEALAQVNQLTSRGARIQIAEQYLFQPMHAARIAVAQSGLLGEISQAQVSFSQGYHNISLIRHYLGVGFEPVRITARKFESPIVKGPDRSGPPTAEKTIPCPQIIASFEFGNRLGIFDFANDQHRSYIRSDRNLIRGDRGEINQFRVRHLEDFRTPIEFDLQRSDAGHDSNLEGYFHHGITGGGKWWYRNPFPNARLADDELAVATCLAKMVEYARGGDPFYSLAEASYDQFLTLKMEESIQKSQAIEAEVPAWAK